MQEDNVKIRGMIFMVDESEIVKIINEIENNIPTLEESFKKGLNTKHGFDLYALIMPIAKVEDSLLTIRDAMTRYPAYKNSFAGVVRKAKGFKLQYFKLMKLFLSLMNPEKSDVYLNELLDELVGRQE